MPRLTGRSAIEGERVTTVLTYLTEGFGGGATNFPFLNLSVGGGGGDAAAEIEGEKTTIGASASPPPPQLPRLWLGVGDAILFWSLHHNGSLNPLSTHQGQPTHELVRLLYQLHVHLFFTSWIDSVL